MTQVQYRGLEVVEQREQRTQLIDPHNGGKLTFLHPPYGPNTYADAGVAIEQDQLKRPIMAETASLVLAAFNSPKDDRYRKEIEGIMRVRWLWAFTGTLYIPKEGSFIQDDPEIRDGMPLMSLDDLVQKLNAKDPSVRHVPFGYRVGEMSSLELAKNPYVVGLAGEEGAEKLAKVAYNYNRRPHLSSFNSVDKKEIRVSALGFWDLSHGLGVNDNRGYGYGHGFGILEKTQK